MPKIRAPSIERTRKQLSPPPVLRKHENVDALVRRDVRSPSPPLHRAAENRSPKRGASSGSKRASSEDKIARRSSGSLRPSEVDGRLVNIINLNGDVVTALSPKTHIDDIVKEVKRVVPQARPANVAVSILPIDKVYSSSDISHALEDEYPLDGATNVYVALEPFDLIIAPSSSENSYDCVFVPNLDRTKAKRIRRSLLQMGYEDYRGPFNCEKHSMVGHKRRETDENLEKGIRKIMDCETAGIENIPRERSYVLYDAGGHYLFHDVKGYEKICVSPEVYVEVHFDDDTVLLDRWKFLVFFMKRVPTKWDARSFLPFSLQAYLRQWNCA